PPTPDLRGPMSDRLPVPILRALRALPRQDVSLVPKATVAAAAAWWLARLLPGEDQPYFAALAALLGVYPTVLRSLREAGRYGLGFLLGALLAVPVSWLLGPTLWGIVAVVPLALLLASWPLLDGQGIQVPFTALFTLLAGNGQPVGYAAPRLAHVAIGIAVGLLVNLAWPPALRRAEAGRAAQLLARRTADLLRDIAQEVRSGEPLSAEHRAERARAVHRGTLEVAEAQERAAESHRFNPRSQLTRHGDPRPARTALEALYAVAEQSRVLARAAGRVGGTAQGPPVGDAFRARFGELLELLAELVSDCGSTGRVPPEERLDEAWGRYRELSATTRPGPDPGAGPGGGTGADARLSPGADAAATVTASEVSHSRLVENQLCALALQLLFDIAPERTHGTPDDDVVRCPC
ncbi:FUSC family protein, partial [Streptomyces sp. URMC 123]|uniref:FUSC family protein n=1 Tax=Streptomyces sp. URMC 123 TaxID=3423403 RepID=UPI003F1E424E